MLKLVPLIVTIQLQFVTAKLDMEHLIVIHFVVLEHILTLIVIKVSKGC